MVGYVSEAKAATVENIEVGTGNVVTALGLTDSHECRLRDY